MKVLYVKSEREKTAVKNDKYTELRAGLRSMYQNATVKQINVVFDFLAGHQQELTNELKTIVANGKEVPYLIERCQKWMISQNANIVKKL